jgi:hypothetical protein
MIGADRAARGITSLQSSHPFHIPFNFATITTGTEQTFRVAVNQGDMLVFGLAIWDSDSTTQQLGAQNTSQYWVKITNREYNQSLMSTWVAGLGILETDAQSGGFRFPSPWFVRNGTYLDVTVRCPGQNELKNTSATYTITALEIVLLAQVFPRGYEKEFGRKAPIKQPFFLSYMAPIGFQADTTTGNNIVTTTGSQQLYPAFQASWPPLMWDFELTSISMDSSTLQTTNPAGSGTGYPANLHMLQVIERKSKRMAFRGPCTQANVAGSRVQDACDAYALSAVPTGLNPTDAYTHNLAVPFYCKKGSQLTAKASFNWVYINDAGISFQPSNVNQVVNVVLMGNKFENPDRFPGTGPFSQPPTYAT